MAPKQEEIQRPFAKFSPSLWGDQFINHEYDAQIEDKYSRIVHLLKEEVKGMLTAPATKMVDTMNLIDTLERLGVSYHFKEEIEETLQQIFNMNTDYNDEAYDLCTVATHFRLFRQHDHRISSDIFGRWMTENDEVEEGLKNDAKGLLSLYEACYLRTRGETILENALEFTTASLKSLAPHLESPLRKQVEHALVQSYHFGFPRIEARIFISFYEEFEDKNESLLRFAKLDYNHLQMLHKKELHELSRWWKDLDLLAKLPYTRDRVVECFFWAMGVYHEPQYSHARIMLTKAVAMTSLVDDTYDVYGTIEELDIFTEAIQRWDIEEIKILPEYMKSLYKVLLELYEQFAEELAEEGRSFKVYYAIESLKELTRSYNIEAKWFIQGHLPSFEEYLKNGLISSSCCYLTTSSMIGVESTTKEDFEWLDKKPKMLEALLVTGRVLDDIASYEIEKGRGQIATGIDSYMRDNSTTKEEAMSKFFEIAMDGWKDMNEECLMLPPCSRNVLMQIMNLARVTGACYKGGEDGYTQPEKVLKPHIMALVVDPIRV